MLRVLNFLILLLLGCWVIGFFIYDLGLRAHLFLLLAALATILRVIREK
jgi:hypothetical protein